MLPVEETTGDSEPGNLERFQEGLRAIRAGTERTINLHCCALRNADLEVLAETLRGSHVLELSLYDNGITALGVEHVAASLKETSLQQVVLHSNRIGDEGLQALGAGLQGSALEILDLYSNLITGDGVRWLAACLPSSRLTTLFLGCNEIGNEGAQHLATCLGASVLSSLYLNNTGIRAEGVRALSEVLSASSLTMLDLSCNGLVDVDLASLLEGLKDSGIQEIDLGDLVSEAFLEEISNVIHQTNIERTFVLQMQVEATASHLTLTFRTAGGSEAAILDWRQEQHVRELPDAILNQMRSTGFQVPFKHLRACHLKIVMPAGGVLDVGFYAASLAQQLGL